MKLQIEQKDESTPLPEETGGESKSFRRAGSITQASIKQGKGGNGGNGGKGGMGGMGGSEFAHHGLIGGILTAAVAYVTLMLSYMWFTDLISVQGTALLMLCGGLQLVWVWASVHLALYVKMHPAWGLLGVFFLIGLVFIFLTRFQSPNWRLDKARRETAKATKNAAKAVAKAAAKAAAKKEASKAA